MFIRRLTLLAAGVLLLTASPSLAGTLEDLAADFKTVSGYLVLPVQDEFLIDLDANQGVAAGDLFAVVQPGEKIIHPVTGKVIGSLDVRKAVLQVTQVKSGFSHARLLSGNDQLNRGDVIHRFSNLRATFWDYTGQGESFFADLKNSMPSLEWQDYAAAQAARPNQPDASHAGNVDLLFILDNQKISVRDHSFHLLHSYPSPVSQKTTVSTPKQQASITNAPYRLETAPAVPAGGVLYEASFPGFKSLGSLGFPTVTTDFVQQGQQLLMATSDGKTIKLFAVGDTLKSVTEIQMSDLAQVLSLHWWQPKDDNLCLAVSGWKDGKLSSALYVFDNGRLSLVDEFLPYMFGTFDRNGDGKRELLLAQNFDRSVVWGTVIKEGKLSGKSLSLKKLPFSLPRRFTVAGSLMADITGNGQPETIFVRDGLLYIFSGTKQLYKSPKMMGGTLSRFVYEEQPFARETNINFAAFEVAPIAVDLDHDGQLELLTIASDSGFLGATGIDPAVKKSWLAVLKMRDGMFVKGTLGEELEVPLQGLTLANNQVMFVATEPGSIFGSGGNSQLLVFPLVK